MNLVDFVASVAAELTVLDSSDTAPQTWAVLPTPQEAAQHYGQIEHVETRFCIAIRLECYHYRTPRIAVSPVGPRNTRGERMALDGYKNLPQKITISLSKPAHKAAFEVRRRMIGPWFSVWAEVMGRHVAEIIAWDKCQTEIAALAAPFGGPTHRPRRYDSAHYTDVNLETTFDQVSSCYTARVRRPGCASIQFSDIPHEVALEMVKLAANYLNPRLPDVEGRW